MINPFLAGLLFGAALFTLPSAVAAQDAEGFDAPAEAWRDVDPENLILISTDYGLIGVELYPELAPNHTARIRALARSKFYDNVPFHRVIEGFMNQTGDGANGNGTGDSDLPNMRPEFTFRRDAEMIVTPIGEIVKFGKSVPTGFYKAMPVVSKPIAQAFLTKDGKVDAHALHCKGVTSMARTDDPNSANAQFFLMRDAYPSLNEQYSIWGNTVMGYEHVESPRVGAVGETDGFVPDKMNTVRVAADLPEGDRPTVQVMKTDSLAFKEFLQTQRKASGKLPDICDIKVPSRTR